MHILCLWDIAKSQVGDIIDISFFTALHHFINDVNTYLQKTDDLMCKKEQYKKTQEIFKAIKISVKHAQINILMYSEKIKLRQELQKKLRMKYYRACVHSSIKEKES